MRIAFDTGGTFTDCVYLRGGRLEILKVSSTRESRLKRFLMRWAEFANPAPTWLALS
jgi:N-methylhydantoinase A/oxoprolinase/acetone carboxylase beta subunit